MASEMEAVICREAMTYCLPVFEALLDASPLKMRVKQETGQRCHATQRVVDKFEAHHAGRNLRHLGHQVFGLRQGLLLLLCWGSEG